VESFLSGDLSARKAKTPGIALGGSSDISTGTLAVLRTKGVFQSVKYKEWSRVGDRMLRTKEVLLPTMDFLGGD
jgi:hypothetical protein